jgi:subtilisin family serine protease
MPCIDKPSSTSCGHGTHVAGLIGAIRNNNYGMAGVAPNVKLMILKVASCTGWRREISVKHTVLCLPSLHTQHSSPKNLSLPSQVASCIDGTYSTGAIVKAFDYALRLGAHIVSASIGDAYEIPGQIAFRPVGYQQLKRKVRGAVQLALPHHRAFGS